MQEITPQVEEFTVHVGERQITARLSAPPAERLAARPALLISLGSDRLRTQTEHPFSIATKLFVAHGHRAVSIDLPNHGDRIDAYGEGIEGFRNAFVAGQDAFARLVEDGRALMDALIERGMAEPGRIVIDGTSRGGYMALRLMAADPRILAGAAHAPCTDWRLVREFAADTDREDLAEVRLHQYVDQLVGRPLHFAMGYHDERVSTASCVRLYLDLHAANTAAGYPDSLMDLFITPDEGHGLGEEWRRRGAEFVLRYVDA